MVDFKPQKGDFARFLIEPRTNLQENYFSEPLEIVEVISSKSVLLKYPDGTLMRKKIDKLLPGKLRD